MAKSNAKSKKYNWLSIPPEYYFLILALVFGYLLIIYNPPWQSNDEDRHFMHAYSLAEGRVFPIKGDSINGSYFPEALYSTIRTYQGKKITTGDKFAKDKIENDSRLNLDNQSNKFYSNPQLGKLPFGLLPHTAGIAIAKLYANNPISLMRYGRFAGLLAYIALVFIAIRIIPIYKEVILLLGLTPSFLYQAGSLTYDTLNIAMTLVIFSFSVLLAHRDRNIDWRDIFLFILLCIVHRFSKDGYYFIPLAILIVPKKNFGIGLKPYLYYLIILITTFLMYKLPDWTWGLARDTLDLHLSSPMRTDFLFDKDKNLYNFFSLPMAGLSNVFWNFLADKSEWLSGIVGKFGYSYLSLPMFFVGLHSMALISVSFLSSESTKSSIINSKSKVLYLSIGFLTLFSIIMGFYLFESPVGSNKIFGLQGRYFIPAVPFLLMVFYTGKARFTEYQKWKYPIIAAYVVIILSFTLIFVNDQFY